MEDLYAILYVSDIAEGGDVSAVSAIVTESRVNNERDDITGLLAFDGERFAQYVEGSASQAKRLLERLERDPRHVRMEVLWSGSAGSRRFPAWRMGYLKFDLDMFGLEGLRGKRGDVVLDAFTFILPTLDIDIGGATPSQWGYLTAS